MVYEQNVRWVEKLVSEQNEWRSSTLNLIASENVLSNRARKVLGSDFAHRYAEGHPGTRYYRGTDKIDDIEDRLSHQMKSLFNCKNVDVRPISGTVANEAVFSRYIRWGNVVMVNSTPGGGHISHHKVGSVGKYTPNIIDFPLTKDGYHIDVDTTWKIIKTFSPKVLILGKSLFLFPEPVEKLADMVQGKDTTIIYDAAHVLGLVAGRRFQAPLREGAHLMTGSTHKTFFGSQRGIIASNAGPAEWRKIDKGAFPASSSNHHLDTLTSLAVATAEMLDFSQDYADQVIRNAKRFAKALDDEGFDVQAREFDYTESHQVAVDMARFGGGDEVSRILQDNGIVINMNLLPHERLENVANPAGVRLGVQEMTRFGMREDDMVQIAKLFKKCLIDGEYIPEEVHEMRNAFQHVHYSFDPEGEALLK